MLRTFAAEPNRFRPEGAPDFWNGKGRRDRPAAPHAAAGFGGASGGYSTGRRELIEMQRQRARPYLFSNALAPPIVGAAIEVFSMLTSGDARVDSLQEKARGFRGALRAAGFTVGGDEQHPIVPLMLGDAKVAADFAEALLHRGVYAVGFSYPVVPEGKARVRLQLSGAHTNEQIECAIEALIGVGKEMALIPQ